MLTFKNADMSDPPQAESFQRSVNSEKHKGAHGARTTGWPFLASSFGQTKEEDYTYKYMNFVLIVHFFACLYALF